MRVASSKAMMLSLGDTDRVLIVGTYDEGADKVLIQTFADDGPSLWVHLTADEAEEIARRLVEAAKASRSAACA